MNIKVITNNPLTKEWLKDTAEVELLDCTYRDLLFTIRDLVHKGVKILTHPLSGSVKPNETPYKSVLITKRETGKTDIDSVILIENSIVTFDKFVQKDIIWREDVLYDFQVVDATLIRNAVNSALQ